MVIYCVTGNLHKWTEVSSLLEGSGYAISHLKELGFRDEIEEYGLTFFENALIKARFISCKYRVPAFADDSGLEIQHLDNEPGVRSARYAGPEKDPVKNYELVLRQMQNVKDRKARFVSVVALIHDQKEFLFEGVLDGEIALEPRGSGGFGYDPIFIPAGMSQTLAELGDEVKNKISHRYQAIQKMKLHLASSHSFTGKSPK